MQAVCIKDHGGIPQSPIVQSSPVALLPWWSTLGSQAANGESFGQLKSISVDLISGEDQISDAAQQKHHVTSRESTLSIAEKGSYGTGCNKDSRNKEKSHKLSTAICLQSPLPEHQPHFQLGPSQPRYSNYPYMDQSYSLFAVYGAQKAAHGRMLLPLNVTEDGPIYVNAKQYHGIIRRRQSRAKAELENKGIKARKPYLHESRHLHALRRARGCGGRFVNTKNASTMKTGSKSDKASSRHVSQAAGSPPSEVLPSDSGNMNHAKEAWSNSGLSSSEVTSMYSQRDPESFRIEHLCPPFHSLSHVIDGGQSIGFPTKWVAAGDGCCNFLKYDSRDM